MKKILALLSIQAILSIAVYAQPSNDNCNTATILTRQVGTSCSSTTTATTVAATASPQAAIGSSPNIDDDIWFSFTLGAGQTACTIKFSNIAITGTDNGIIMQLWASDCSTSQPYSQFTGPSVANFDWNMTGLTAGGSYKIRVYTDNITSRANFNICFLAGPTNDDCANATIITPLAGVNPCTFTPGIADGSTMQATPSTQSSGDATGKDDDIWYQFTTTTSPKNYKVDLSNIIYDPVGSGAYPVIELWQTCGDATFLNWYSFTSSANLGTLPANTTYKLRIYTYGTTYRFSSFNLCISYTTPPPTNDSYFSSTTISLSNSNSCSSVVTGGTTVGATADMIPTCSGGPAIADAKDVWYKFVPTTASATIKLTNKTLVSGTSNLMWLQVYESSNTNLKLCSDNNTADSVVFDGSTAARTLTPGTTYYIRIYNQDPASACTFDICNYVPKGPTYDECINAVNISISTNEYCNNKVNISTVNSTTSSITAPPCASSIYNDVWVKFVAPTPIPSSGLIFTISNYQSLIGINPGYRYAVYSGTCGSLSYLSCDALPTLVAGNTYYIRIFNTSGSGTGTFDVCLAPYPTAQTNTTCATATTLVATADQSATYVQGTTYGLATSNTITDCFGYSGPPNKVLWYKFVATSTTHYIQFSDMINLDANSNSIGYRVTTGSCPSTTALSSPVCVFGVNNTNNAISGLTIGQTYYIEVMENTFNGGAVSFKLRVIGTTAPVNNQPSAPTLLIQNPTCNTINGTFRFAGLDVVPAVPASLGSTYYQDVWYKFQAAATTATITVGGRITIPRIAIYNSSATTLLDAGVEGYSYSLSGLTVGSYYVIRLINTSSSSDPGPMSDFTICVSGIPSTTLASGPTPSTCLVNDNVVISNASNRWLHFTRGGNLIASVFDGVAMGNMTAKYYINTGAVRSNTGVEYMDRNMEITPVTQPTSPVNVRLYFTRDEFERFVAANDGDGNDAYWLNDLKIAKFSSLSCTDAISGSGEALYGLARYGSLSANVYYLEVVVPSFSSFFFKNVASSTVVPFVCNDFNYKIVNDKILLNWTAITEPNNNYFEIQKSVDGISFKTIGIINDKQDYNSTNTYQFVDGITANNSKVYYRLASISKDGKRQIICRTITLNSKSSAITIGNLYPNPANDFVIADIQKPYTGNVVVQIFNAMGQKVTEQKLQIGINDFQLKINTAKLAKGSYSVKFITTEETITQQLTKM